MKIAHNISALNTTNRLNKSNKSSGASLEKLSSGLRINRAADDAAGLAISQQMRGQIRGLEQASRNIQDGTSLVQTAEGGFQEITAMIHRQKELIIQGMNGTYSDHDRRNIELEIKQLTEEIDNIARRTDFNTINLLSREDYQVLEDRSSLNVDVTNSGPFPTTVTDREVYYGFYPVDTPDQPKYVVRSTTETTTNNEYDHEAQLTPIVSPDGRPGYNDYEKNVHTQTDTTATNEFTFERIWYNEPKFKELDIKNMTIGDIYFQTEYVVNSTVAGQYPDFGGFQDGSTIIEIDGVPHTLSTFTVDSANISPGSISVFYSKDGIEIEKMITTDGTSFTAEFKVRNQSGVDDKQIKFSTVFKPRYDANYDISSSNGVPIGTPAASADIPDTGPVFELSNDLVDFEFAFLNGGSYSKPDSLTTDSAELAMAYNAITTAWENAVLDDGEVLEFGFSLSNFNFKKDVFRFEEEYTETIHSIVETVTTDIKDIDYIPPKVDIQTGDRENQVLNIPLFNVKSDGLGIANIGILPPADPEASLAQTEGALKRVNNFRSIYGALQNRLEHTMKSVDNYAENLMAAESRIRDTDMAKEMMELTKSNILTQAAQAMLSHANSNPQSILQLIK
ncbi:flagellin [Paenibacillus pinisoli]|nr:flagellin [Paenibacillus pinisoli]